MTSLVSDVQTTAFGKASPFDEKHDGKAQRKGQSKRIDRRSQRSPFAGQKRHARQEFQPRYALTLGDQAEIRVGSTLQGAGLAEHGFSVEELKQISAKLGSNCILRVLSDALDERHRSGNEAAVLLIKNGVNLIMDDATFADRMLSEQKHVQYDAKYFDRRRQTTLKNQARLNVVFGEVGRAHTEDYKQGTIVAWQDVPLFAQLRQTLSTVLGPKSANLHGEGNLYHHHTAGIGFHGDSERKIVVGTCLGSAATLRFYWRAPHSRKLHKGPFDFKVEHGDIYIMSEKASGFDWKRSSKFRLVHAAGAPKHIGKLE